MENMHELSNKDFEAYIERIRKIGELSSPLIDDMRSPDDYIDTLSGNFREIGGLAMDNRKMIADKLDPILDSDEPLTEETIEQIEELIAELVDANAASVTDANYAARLSERLMQNSNEKQDILKYLKCIDLLITAYHIQYIYATPIISAAWICDEIRKKLIDIHKILMRFIDKSCFKQLDMESRYIVMVNARFCLANLLTASLPVQYEIRQYCYEGLMKCLSYASDPFYTEALPDYNWRGHVYRVYEYFLLVIDIENYAGYTDSELRKIAERAEEVKKLIDSDPGYYHNNYSTNDVYYCIENIDYLLGKVSKKELKNILYNRYLSRKTKDYDRNSISENLYVVSDYSCLIDKKNIKEQEKSILSRMYYSYIDYCFNAPSNDIDFDFIMDTQRIANCFIEFSGGITIEEFVLNLFAAIHPPTYIHSHMVAKIARCITHHLLKAKAALFVGVCGCPDAESVPEHAEKIENYAYHSALCHDFGKIYIISIISTYGRKILDDEFALIKQHPAMGALLLEKHESTKAYADVAKGHHLWYNCERGYPTDFDAKSSPVKTIIDIVACADCMDAATDKVGRSYNKGKTLDEYIEEVREGSGTHYAPYLYELLKQEDVYDDIEYLLDEGRKNTYRETYLLLKNVREKAKTSG